MYVFGPKYRNPFITTPLQPDGADIPKGKDAAGRDTRAEFITRPLLKLDISPVIGQKAHVLELGVGFQYFHNMFGKDASRVPGADEFTPVLSLAVHLPLGGSGH